MPEGVVWTPPPPDGAAPPPDGAAPRPRRFTTDKFVPPAVTPLFGPGGSDVAFASAVSDAPDAPKPISTRQMSAPERILQRLDWKVIRRLDGVLQGDYRSLFRGNGVDLVDLR